MSTRGRKHMTLVLRLLRTTWKLINEKLLIRDQESDWSTEPGGKKGGEGTERGTVTDERQTGRGRDGEREEKKYDGGAEMEKNR